MVTTTNYSSKYDIKNETTLRKKLEESGFNFSALDYAFWKAAGKNVTVSLYKSGKILVQGQGTDNFVQEFLNSSGQLSFNVNTKNSEKSPKLQHSFTCWVGTDESGKGDYLGPLVIAGVLVDEKNRKILEDSGIKDSKKMNEAAIIKAAQIIRKSSVFSVVVIGPQKYNELYEKFKNLNKLLAWGHARVIENIIEKSPSCNNVISDKFGDESLIKNALMKQGRTINLVQEIKAENDIAVAAASVVAREEFVRRMKNLETQYRMSFPKGASERVVEQANLFVKKYGRTKLSEVAKLHFKTTQQITH